MNALSQSLHPTVAKDSTLIPFQTLSVPKASGGTGDTAVLASVSVPKGCMVVVEAEVQGYQATAGTVGFYKIVAVATNKAGTTALVGSASVTAFENTSAWDATAVANDTNDTLDIQVTGENSSGANMKYTGLATVRTMSLAIQ